MCASEWTVNFTARMYPRLFSFFACNRGCLSFSSSATNCVRDFVDLGQSASCVQIWQIWQIWSISCLLTWNYLSLTDHQGGNAMGFFIWALYYHPCPSHCTILGGPTVWKATVPRFHLTFTLFLLWWHHQSLITESNVGVGK